jgi:hypothetical protein
LPPTISCPANLVLSTAPGQCSATGNYTVTATDNCAVVSLVVSPPSGSVFPKGTNVVMCVATDCAGNSNTCVFTVTVVDQEPPVLSCPTNQTVACNSTNGAQAFFTPTAADNCDGSVPVICTPTSGSYFGLGTNTVLCVASDSTGNTNSCTFTVVVFENPPTLSLTLNGATCALTWPQRCAAYVVEQKSSLDPAENWATVTNTPAVSGNSFAVTVPLDSAGRFFRLKQN